MRYVLFVDAKQLGEGDHFRKDARTRARDIPFLLYDLDTPVGELESLRDQWKSQMAAIKDAEASASTPSGFLKSLEADPRTTMLKNKISSSGAEDVASTVARAIAWIGLEPGTARETFVSNIGPENFTAQAIVSSDTFDNEEIYTEMQNGVIHDSWSRAEGRTFERLGPSTHNDLGRRTMSVGDIIASSDGSLAVVAPIGFVTMTMDDMDRLRAVPTEDDRTLGDLFDLERTFQPA